MKTKSENLLNLTGYDVQCKLKELARLGPKEELHYKEEDDVITNINKIRREMLADLSCALQTFFTAVQISGIDETVFSIGDYQIEIASCYIQNEHSKYFNIYLCLSDNSTAYNDREIMSSRQYTPNVTSASEMILGLIAAYNLFKWSGQYIENSSYFFDIDDNNKE